MATPRSQSGGGSAGLRCWLPLVVALCVVLAPCELATPPPAPAPSPPVAAAAAAAAATEAAAAPEGIDVLVSSLWVEFWIA